MNNTKQEKFWQSDFGAEYTERNPQTADEIDKETKQMLGVSRSYMNKEFLKDLEIKNVLEVGSNVGSQLALLQKQGYTNLYGIEIQDYAVEKAKSLTKNINIITGSAFDLPFKDNYFDLVFTSGMLIHISPAEVEKAMQEIYRVSGRYIWGFEYYNDQYQEIEYRGNKDYLWKGNYCQMYLDLFKNLELVKRKKYKYVDSNNVDEMFIFKKI